MILFIIARENMDSMYTWLFSLSYFFFLHFVRIVILQQSVENMATSFVNFVS